MANRIWMLLWISTCCASGETLSVVAPHPGFEQNVGQLSGDVLFSAGWRRLFRTRAELNNTVSVEFIDSQGPSSVTGRNPAPFPLHVYTSNPAQRRENVPHFATVRYAEVYPGIDIDFNVALSGATGKTPAIQMTVSAETDPQRFAMRVTRNRYDPVFELWTTRAFQTIGNSTVAILCRPVWSGDIYRLEIGPHDASVPLIVEIGEPFSNYAAAEKTAIARDNSVYWAGFLFYDTPRRGFVAKSLADGTPVFLAAFEQTFPFWLNVEARGTVSVAARFARDWKETGLVPPVTALAPRAVPNPTSDAWLGRIGADGRLEAATYTGDGTEVVAPGAGGGIYFATANSVVKWVPGDRDFAFTAPIAEVAALNANATTLAFVARGTPGRPATPGAMLPEYEGAWTQYAGTLDAHSGRVLMATYVAVAGKDFTRFDADMTVMLSPSGTLWIASRIRTAQTLFTLVALSGDGKREVASQSLPFLPRIAFDANGSVLLAATTDRANLPTTVEAPLRGPCFPQSPYVARLDPNGRLLEATYVNIHGEVQEFGGIDRLFVRPWFDYTKWERTEVRVPAGVAIACLVNPATRRVFYGVRRGELVTILGNGLGPLEVAQGSLDDEGNLPVSLGGVEVMLNGTAAQLLSVQQGAITFYAPESLTPIGVTIEVRARGVPIVETRRSVETAPRFAVFTVDGSGDGFAAAVNQDGSLNHLRGAPEGSVVAVYGMGTAPTSASVQFVPATIEYAGPAPGMPPGVKQVNIRIPAGVRPPSGDLARLSLNPFETNGPSIRIRVR